VMSRSFRKSDVVFRVGGEEFLAILHGSNLNGACIAAEKFRKSIESHVIQFEGKVIPVTSSSGIAAMTKPLDKGLADTIHRADEALYHSKRTGRNRVSLHNGSEIQAYGIVPIQAAS